MGEGRLCESGRGRGRKSLRKVRISRGVFAESSVRGGGGAW